MVISGSGDRTFKIILIFKHSTKNWKKYMVKHCLINGLMYLLALWEQMMMMTASSPISISSIHCQGQINFTGAHAGSCLLTNHRKGTSVQLPLASTNFFHSCSFDSFLQALLEVFQPTPPCVGCYSIAGVPPPPPALNNIVPFIHLGGERY